MNSFAHRVVIAAVVSAASIVAACGGRGAPATGNGSIATVADDHLLTIRVDVQNDNMQDVNVYVLHGGLRSRVGVAGAASASSFTFPAYYAARATMVQIAAVPLIGGRFGWRKSIVSDPVSVQFGQRILFSLESDLSRSTIAVYSTIPDSLSDSTQAKTPSDSTVGKTPSEPTALGAVVSVTNRRLPPY
jgi:hypothetical protein